MRIVVPKGRSAEAKYAAEVTPQILTRLEEYFGIPYPYDKADQVSVPVTFGFGAMENAGMVTYGQTLILAEPSSDGIARQREYASVAAHELAHQWFGDLVTTSWWNDIWLNEAFATWMEQKLLAEWKPEWNSRIGDVNTKLEAEDQDSLISARQIRQPIESKGDIGAAFDSITYLKGAAVIGMFENWMGSTEFRAGVQRYLDTYAFRTATAGNFLDSLSAGGKNVTAAFSTFLNQPGVPMVSVALACNGGAKLHLEQKRSLPIGSEGLAAQQWSIPLCVRYGSEGGTARCGFLHVQAIGEEPDHHIQGIFEGIRSDIGDHPQQVTVERFRLEAAADRAVAVPAAGKQTPGRGELPRTLNPRQHLIPRSGGYGRSAHFERIAPRPPAAPQR